MSSPTLKHNIYFDGQVQSVAFERHGRRASVGVIAPGEYHFGTEAPERMTVVSGALSVRFDGDAGKPDDASAWVHYPAGTSFEIAGKSGFDVRAASAAAYLCEYL